MSGFWRDGLYVVTPARTTCGRCGGKGYVAVPDSTGECIDWDSCPDCEART